MFQLIFYYIAHALISFAVTALAVLMDFSKHYGITFSETTEKIKLLDPFSQQYILLLFIFVLALRFTYELLPVKKIYFPAILLVIVLFLPIPRLFQYLLAFTCISLYLSNETIDFIKWAKDRIRSATKK